MAVTVFGTVSHCVNKCDRYYGSSLSLFCLFCNVCPQTTSHFPDTTLKGRFRDLAGIIVKLEQQFQGEKKAGGTLITESWSAFEDTCGACRAMV